MEKTRKFTLWAALLAMFALLCLQPAGFMNNAFAAANFDNATSEYAELELSIGNYERKTFEIPRAFSYAFTWEGGTFKINSLQAAGLSTITEDIDLFNEETGRHSSIMYYELPAQLVVENLTAREIKLAIFNPNEATGANDYIALTPGGGQTNLSSGAHYSDLPIVNRNEWGANPALLNWTPRYQTPEGFIIHHTAITPDPENYARSVRAIYTFHSVTNGWGDIGYNYLIDPDGNIYEGRVGGDGAIGAHTYRLNGGNIGIALMGDFSSAPPTIQATRSLRYLMAERSQIHGIALEWGTTVSGHRDSPYSNTACPGQSLYNILPTITQEAEDRRRSNDVAGNALFDARQEALTALAGYQDTRLRLTFDPDVVSGGQTPSSLTPANSAIVARVYDNVAGTAVITVESILSGEFNWRDDTLNRLVNLYTTFLLDPNVVQVELVTDEVHPRLYHPTGTIDFELIYNPLARYNGNIALGTGSIGVYDVTDDVYVANYDVTDNARVQIHYGRHLNVYQDFDFAEGHIYRIEVCDGCATGSVSGDPLPAYSWQFTVKESEFSPVYRFWSDRLATHFYTTNASERTKLTTQEPFSAIWNEEGIGFRALTGNNCAKGQRVFRFWSDQYQNHFYTINYTEYDKLTTNSQLKAVWRYEGVGFCAYDYQRLGTSPVYRFWSDTFKGHFYTISQSERDRLIARFADTPEIWRYEKVAFYAMP